MIRSDLRKLALLAIGSLALLTPVSAHAFEFEACNGEPIVWLKDMQTLFIDTTSFRSGGTADRIIRRVISKWNRIVGVDFSFNAMPDPDPTHDNSNMMNELYLDSTLDPSAITMTLVRSTCNPGVEPAKLNEVDIAFNSNVSWSMGTYNYANPVGPPFNFEGAALHEVGHALGLLHEDDDLATMNTFYPFGGPLGSAKEWDPIGDDRQGDRRLYPSIPAEVDIDVAASPLKATGLGTSALISSPSEASPGSTVEIEYTFANLGSATQFTVGFYLSTDNTIAVSDRLLGTQGVGISAEGTFTLPMPLDIPMDTAPRQYFLGFIVDPDDLLLESNEGNNAQVLPTRIRIQ